MVKHIVLWKINNNCDKITVQNNIKSILENLNGKIEGLLHLEVGFDFNNSESSADISLYSEFTDKNALEYYQNHPLHKEAAEYVKANTNNRIVADYEK